LEEEWEKFGIAEAAVSWEGGLAAFCDYSGFDLSKYPLSEPIECGDTAIENAPLRKFLKALMSIDLTKKWTLRQKHHPSAFGTNFPKTVGTPDMVISCMKKWLVEADVDGFNISCRGYKQHDI
jgi:hypothetical protein